MRKRTAPISPEWTRDRRRLVLAGSASGMLAACGGGGGEADPTAQPQDATKRPLGVDAGGTGLSAFSLISVLVSTLLPNQTLRAASRLPR